MMYLDRPLLRRPPSTPASSSDHSNTSSSSSRGAGASPSRPLPQQGHQLSEAEEDGQGLPHEVADPRGECHAQQSQCPDGATATPTTGLGGEEKAEDEDEDGNEDEDDDEDGDEDKDAAFEGTADSDDPEVLARRCRRKKEKRPCKGRRVRYKTYVESIEAQVREDPHGFDISKVHLPQFVISNPKLTEKLRARLSKFRVECMLSGGTAGAPARPSSTANPSPSGAREWQRDQWSYAGTAARPFLDRAPHDLTAASSSYWARSSWDQSSTGWWPPAARSLRPPRAAAFHQHGWWPLAEGALPARYPQPHTAAASSQHWWPGEEDAEEAYAEEWFMAQLRAHGFAPVRYPSTPSSPAGVGCSEHAKWYILSL
uniref:Uncharacterized protein n=1 Tax=Alexandrium catenella TaxID=2925 RepID=A0A7S1S2D9_ALECA